MSRGWRRAAFAILAVAALGTVPSFPAVAAPVGAGAHSQPGPAQTDDAPRFLQLAVDSVAPTSVTTTSDPFVVVTGTVANIGDREVDDISVRMQRAPAVATSAELRTALQLDQQNFDVVGKFVPVADSLGAGQRKQFTLTMPIHAGTGGTPGLEITDPGVYPMLLNVNGAPAEGSQARLDDARFLLPVLGVPADPSVSDPQQPGGRPVAPATESPVALTMLWPIADRPRLTAGLAGSIDQRVRLDDDALATELAGGGRLDQLAATLEAALRPTMDRDGKLGSSTCLAVDPDLLVTVSAMTRGYLVVDDPGDPTGAAHDGAGTPAAVAWLDRMRALAGRVCTVALPFAQVDLTALGKTGNTALRAAAVTSPADIVDGVLGVTSKRNVTWPDSGTVDDDTAGVLAGLGAKTLLLAGNAVATDVDEPVAPPDVVRMPSPMPGTAAPVTGSPADTQRAATFDVSTATALAALGAEPQIPSFTPAKARYNLSEDSRPARLQDAIGALSWPSLSPRDDRPRSLLVAPPQQWSVDDAEASGVLGAVTTLLRSGLATPRSFDALLAEPPDPRAFQANYPQRAVDNAVPEAIRVAADMQAGRIDTLNTALVDDPNSELTPQRFSAPLRENLLRAMSLSGRRDDRAQQAERDAERRITLGSNGVDSLFKSVTLLAPGGVYTLASEQSPLLLVARNDLPIGIRVRLHLDAPAQMQITDIGEQQLPPRGSRALQVPTEVNDTQNLVVDVALTTPSGQALGDPTKVSVRSNAYGQALAIITGCAGALLLLLAGRRLWHRFRGQPDPADEEFQS